MRWSHCILSPLGAAVLAMLVIPACSAEPGAIDPLAGSPPERVDLTYTSARYMVGLAESVTIVKDPRRIVVQRADGRHQTLPELENDERAARWRRFGSLAPELALDAQSAQPGNALPITIHVELDVSWADITRELNAGDPARRRRAQDGLRVAIGARTRQVLPELVAMGLTALSPAELSPVIFARAPPAVLAKVARHPGIALVTTNKEGTVETFSGGPTNAISYPAIDSEFNARGFFGAGQKIAVVEGAACGLLGPHEAFSAGPGFTYEVEPLDCRTDADCALCGPHDSGRCLPLGRPGHPRQCVYDHASEAASTISATREGTPFGAAKAALYYPNRGNGDPSKPRVACSPDALQDAYEWLLRNGVTTVSESFGCASQGGGSVDGGTQDWFARNYDMSIFKAAGNQRVRGKPAPNDPACPYTLNSVCVGGVNRAGRMSCFSSWTNMNGNDGQLTDREEPDIVALAGDNTNGCETFSAGVDILSLTGGWASANGTSFAAPAMAGFTALLKEACGGEIDQKSVRAILRNASWARNPEGWRYSTPKWGFDHKDGAGSPVAEAALGFCGYATAGSGPAQRVGRGDGDLRAGEPLPDGKLGYDDRPPGANADGVRTRSLAPPGSADGRIGAPFFETEELNVGDRVRVSFVWDSCPESMSAMAPAAVATDYDVFLMNAGTGEYLYSSQSVSDNAEGFDVTIPAGPSPSGKSWAGKYVAYYAWPKGSSGCGGSGREPFAWAASWWVTPPPPR